MLSTIMLLPENLHFEVSVINKVGRYLLLTSFGEDMSKLIIIIHNLKFQIKVPLMFSLLIKRSLGMKAFVLK